MKIYWGFVAGCGVKECLDRVLAQFAGALALLITQLDSSPRPATSCPAWIRRLEKSGVDYRNIDGHVWIASEDVPRLLREQASLGTFSHFDEVYALIDAEPPGGIPLASHHTVDAGAVGPSVPDELVKQLLRIGAVAYLTDGNQGFLDSADGLNWASTEEEIAKVIAGNQGESFHEIWYDEGGG